MRRACPVALAIALLAVAGCGGKPAVDTDQDQVHASRLVPGILINDSLDARSGGGDLVDWRRLSNYEAGQAHVVFSVGDRFGNRDFQGTITLYAPNGEVLDSKRVIPDVVDYTFSFPMAREVEYFFKIAGEKGRTTYKVNTRIDPPDPCANCAPGEECCKPTNLCCPAGSTCRDGACMPSDTCVPACRASRGQVCEAGRCVDACPGGCRRGMRCDVNHGRCVPVRTSEPPPRRETPTETKPAGCSPACRDGERCNMSTGQCETVAYIDGTVLQVKESGTGSLLLVNRGSKDGVRMGASGSMGSVSLKVVYVSSTRCRVQAEILPSKVKPSARVRINR